MGLVSNSGQGINLGNGEILLSDYVIQQLQNVAVDISSDKWEIVGALDQSIATTDDVEFGSLTIDNLLINGNNISSTSGDINITPISGSDVVIDNHFEFDGNVLNSLTDNNTVVTAYLGKNITIEDVTFDGGDIAAVTSLTVDNIIINGNDISSSSGNITISPFGSVLTTINSDINNLSDTKKLMFGASNDMEIYYDSANGIINSNVIAASDININCGSEKTIILVNPVIEDLQFSVSGARVPAANAPTWEALTTNNFAYSFAVNDYKDQNNEEIPHSWKVGTNGSMHLHVATKAANATGGDMFAKFTIYFTYVNNLGIWTETPATAELTIPDGTAAKKAFLLTMGTLDFSTLNLNTQMGCRVKRIAATGGTEYTGNIFITQVGVHIYKDKLGSRTLTS